MKARVIEKSVNVRAAPDTKAKITGKLKEGDEITLIGKNNDGQWYQAIIAGLTEPGWVFAELVEIVSGDQNTLPARIETPTPRP